MPNVNADPMANHIKAIWIILGSRLFPFEIQAASPAQMGIRNKAKAAVRQPATIMRAIVLFVFIGQHVNAAKMTGSPMKREWFGLAKKEPA